MKRAAIHLVFLLLSLIVLSCQQRRYAADINRALMLCESDPDSVLNMLDKIRKHDLSVEEYPVYCLAYTVAQDKIGLDVDNDSLIRIAFNAFTDHQSRYYTRSQFYMGKYYMLNDSIEKATTCFDNARESAAQQQDTAYLCLALDRMSCAISPYDQKKALEYAKKAGHLYSLYSGATVLNQVLYYLNISYCYDIMDNFDAALQENERALSVALNSRDSVAISNVYYNRSVIYNDYNMTDSALLNAKRMFDYWDDLGVSYELLLANAYFAADSLTEAKDIYKRSLNRSVAFQTSAMYIKLQEIAIQENERDLAVAYGDSAYQYLGEMYSSSLEQRNLHYKNLIAQEKKTNVAEHNAYRFKWIIGFIVLVLCYVTYIYIMYRKRARERVVEEKEKANLALKHERAIHDQELSFKEEQHKRDLKSRDLQIEIMQKYLMEKIKVVQKIKAMKDGKSRTMFSEDDWKEIEILLENSECRFVSRLRTEFPELREKDVRLMMLLRVKMPQKSIAEYYGISEKAVKQKLYLYKEKVQIKDENKSLREFIESY